MRQEKGGRRPAAAPAGTDTFRAGHAYGRDDSALDVLRHAVASTTAAPRIIRTPPRAPGSTSLLARIEDAYFDYDQHTLRPDAIKALQADSTELRDILKDYPDYKLTVEGHCDERGSAEYNMALGEKRAEAAKDYLVSVGIPSAQLSIISYGKEKPVCEEHDEACWQKNRRIHIVAMAN